MCPGTGLIEGGGAAAAKSAESAGALSGTFFSIARSAAFFLLMGAPPRVFMQVPSVFGGSLGGFQFVSGIYRGSTLWASARMLMPLVCRIFIQKRRLIECLHP